MTEQTPVNYLLPKIFWKLGPAYTRWVEGRLKESGTTPHRLRVIQILSDNGPTSMKRLADEVGVTSANMTGLIDALERDGRVSRVTHPTDRRSFMIEVKPETKKKFASSRKDYQAKLSTLFDIFSKQEQAQLLSYLERIEAALVADGTMNKSDVS